MHYWELLSSIIARSKIAEVSWLCVKFRDPWWLDCRLHLSSDEDRYFCI